jgi:hypothetical protein
LGVEPSSCDSSIIIEESYPVRKPKKGALCSSYTASESFRWQNFSESSKGYSLDIWSSFFRNQPVGGGIVQTALSNSGANSGSNGGIIGTLVGVGACIFFPILYAVLGFIGGVITAVIIDITLALSGGLEFGIKS